ncbi:uncharacterized protein UTRI_02307 [Ustilago trichophora]|uniref:Uncharacterized protein n=1 Tax=Ustilago trichophora TaxID=86804 RepID=A0A5C3E5R2_9BASI|nr:uncharacterized protein UTRI_02307 [Ustilago trichophora]
MANTAEQRGFWLSCQGQSLAEELPVQQPISPPFAKVLVTGVQGESFQLRISKDVYRYGAHVYFRGKAKNRWEYFFDAIPDLAYLHRHRDPAVTQHADPFWECWFPKWIFGQTNLVWAVVVPLTREGRYDGFGQQVAFVLKAQPRHWQVANADELLIQRLMEITLGPKEEEDDQNRQTAHAAATPPPDSESSTPIVRTSDHPVRQPEPGPSFDPFAAKAAESRRFVKISQQPLPSSSLLRQPSALRRPAVPLQPSVRPIAEATQPDLESRRDFKHTIRPSVLEPPPPRTHTPARTEDAVRTPTPQVPNPAQVPSPIRVQAAARAHRQTQTSSRSRSNIRTHDAIDSDYSSDDDDDTPFSELLRPLTDLEVSAIGLATPEANAGPRKSKRIQQLRRRASSSAEADAYRFLPIRPTDRWKDIERLESFWHLPVTANAELRFLLTVELDPHDISDADSTSSRELQSEEESDDESGRDNSKDLVPVQEVPNWIRQITGGDVSVRRQDLACPVRDVSFEDTLASIPTLSHSPSPTPVRKKAWNGIPCQKYNHIGLLDPVLNQRYEIRICEAAEKAKANKAEANKAKTKARKARERRRQLRR